MSNVNIAECYPSNIEEFPQKGSVYQTIIDKCLGKSKEEDPTGDDCLAKWKEKKDQAKSNLIIANANVSEQTKIVAAAEHWEKKLKIYWDNIEKTNELANKVAREIGVLKKHLGKFCKNAGYMVEALEILYCQVQSIYTPCVNEMVTLLDKINKCLACITDPAFDRSQGITKAIDAYAEKLRELAGLQKDTLSKIIKALECANIIYYTLCDAEGKKQDFKCDSLEKELANLYHNFGKDIKCDPNKDPRDPIKVESLNCPLNTAVLEPIPGMPICRDDYFKNTLKEYGKAKTDRDTAKGELDKAKEAQQNAAMCYNGVNNAIEAAKQAKSG